MKESISFTIAVPEKEDKNQDYENSDEWSVVAFTCRSVMKAGQAKPVTRCNCKFHHVVFNPYWIYSPVLNRICCVGKACLDKMGLGKDGELLRRALRTCLGCKTLLPAFSLPDRTCESCHYEHHSDFSWVQQDCTHYHACTECFRYFRRSHLHIQHRSTLCDDCIPEPDLTPSPPPVGFWYRFVDIISNFVSLKFLSF